MGTAGELLGGVRRSGRQGRCARGAIKAVGSADVAHSTATTRLTRAGLTAAALVSVGWARVIRTTVAMAWVAVGVVVTGMNGRDATHRDDPGELRAVWCGPVLRGLARDEDQQQQHIAIGRCMVLMFALIPWMFTACLVLDVVAYRLDVWRYGRLFAHCTRCLSSVCEKGVVFLRGIGWDVEGLVVVRLRGGLPVVDFSLGGCVIAAWLACGGVSNPCRGPSHFSLRGQRKVTQRKANPACRPTGA